MDMIKGKIIMILEKFIFLVKKLENLFLLTNGKIDIDFISYKFINSKSNSSLFTQLFINIIFII